MSAFPAPPFAPASAPAAGASSGRLHELAAAAAAVGLDPSAAAPPAQMLAVVSAVYSTGDATAHAFLNAYTASPHAWDTAHALLDAADSPACLAAHAHHYAAALLEDKVKLEWATMAPDARESVRQLLLHHATARCAAMHASLADAHTAAGSHTSPARAVPTAPGAPYSRVSLVVTHKLCCVLAFLSIADGAAAARGLLEFALGSAAASASASALASAATPASVPSAETILALELVLAFAEQRTRPRGGNGGHGSSGGGGGGASYRRGAEVAAAVAAHTESVLALLDSLLAPLYPLLLDPARCSQAISVYARAWAAQEPLLAAREPCVPVRLKEVLSLPLGTPANHALFGSDLSAVLPSMVTDRVLAALAAWAPLLDSAASAAVAGSGFLLHALVALVPYDRFAEQASGVLSELLAVQTYPRPSGHDEAVTVIAKGLAEVGLRAGRREFTAHCVPESGEWITQQQQLAAANGEAITLVPFDPDTVAAAVAAGAIPVPHARDFDPDYVDMEQSLIGMRCFALLALALAEHETFYLVRGDPECLSLMNEMLVLLSHPQRTRVSALIIPFFASLQTARVRDPRLRQRLALSVFRTLVLQLTATGLAPYAALCQCDNFDVSLTAAASALDAQGNLVAVCPDTGAPQPSRICGGGTGGGTGGGAFDTGTAWLELSPSLHAEACVWILERARTVAEPDDADDVDLYCTQVEDLIGDLHGVLRHSAVYLLVTSLGITHADLQALLEAGVVEPMPPLCSPLLFADAPASLIASMGDMATAIAAAAPVSRVRAIFAGVPFNSFAGAMYRCLISVAHHVQDGLEELAHKEETRAAAAAAAAAPISNPFASASSRLIGLAVGGASATASTNGGGADGDGGDSDCEGGSGSGSGGARATYHETAYILRLLFGSLYEHVLSSYSSVAAAASGVCAAEFQAMRQLVPHIGASGDRLSVMTAILSAVPSEDAAVMDATYVLLSCRLLSSYSWLLPQALPHLIMPVHTFLYSLALASAPLPRASAHAAFAAAVADLSSAASAAMTAAAAAGSSELPPFLAGTNVQARVTVLVDEVRLAVMVPAHPAAVAFAIVARECAGIIASSLELLAGFFTLFSQHYLSAIEAGAATETSLHDAAASLAHTFRPDIAPLPLEQALHTYAAPVSLGALSLSHIALGQARVLARLPSEQGTAAAVALSAPLVAANAAALAAARGWTSLLSAASTALDADFATRRVGAAAAWATACGTHADNTTSLLAAFELDPDAIYASMAAAGADGDADAAGVSAAAGAAAAADNRPATLRGAGGSVALRNVLPPDELTTVNIAAWGLSHTQSYHNLAIQRFCFLTQTTPLGALITVAPPLFADAPALAPWARARGAPQEQEGPENGDTVRGAVAAVTAGIVPLIQEFCMLAPALARLPFSRRPRPLLPPSPATSIYCGAGAGTDRDRVRGGLSQALGSHVNMLAGSTGSGGRGSKQPGVGGASPAIESPLTAAVDVMLNVLTLAVDAAAHRFADAGPQCSLLSAFVFTQYPPPTVLFPHDSGSPTGATHAVAAAVAAAAAAAAAGLAPDPTTSAHLTHAVAARAAASSSMSLSPAPLNMIAASVGSHGAAYAAQPVYAAALSAVVMHAADVVHTHCLPHTVYSGPAGADGVAFAHTDALAALFSVLLAALQTQPTIDETDPTVPGSAAALLLASSTSGRSGAAAAAGGSLFSSVGSAAGAAAGAGSGGLRSHHSALDQSVLLYGPAFLLSRGLFSVVTELLAQAIAECGSDRGVMRAALDYAAALFTAVEKDEQAWGARVRHAPATATTGAASPPVAPESGAASGAADWSGLDSLPDLFSDGTTVSPRMLRSLNRSPRPPAGSHNTAAGAASAAGAAGRLHAYNTAATAAGGGCAGASDPACRAAAAAAQGNTRDDGGLNSSGGGGGVGHTCRVLQTVIPPLFRLPDGSLTAITVPDTVKLAQLPWPGVSEDGVTRGALTWLSCAFRPASRLAPFARLCVRDPGSGQCAGHGFCGGPGGCVAMTLAREVGFGALLLGGAHGCDRGVYYPTAARAGGQLARALLYAIGGLPALPQELLNRAASALLALLFSAPPSLVRQWLGAAVADSAFPATHIAADDREKLAELIAHLIAAYGEKAAVKSFAVVDRLFKVFVADLAAVLRGTAVPISTLLDHAARV